MSFQPTLSAAVCRWLTLVAEFDRRGGWARQGAKSCSQWLSWKCGLSLVSAREHLRVGRRLKELPLVTAAFASGELSYSKVRALVRIATPATEGPLVQLARNATAAHMERIARARRSAGTDDEAEEAERRHEARHVHWFWDEDGSLVLTARLGPDEGALVLQALDAAAHALRGEADGDDDAAASPAPTNDDAASPALTNDAAGSSQSAQHSTEENLATARRRNAEAVRIPTSRADALVAMAETVLAHGPTARDGGERYQLVVTVSLGALAGEDPAGGGEVDNGPWLTAEASRRLACDPSVVALSLGKGGEPLSVGRATSSVPRHIRRALRTRDGGCRFPGCGQRRFVDGHHILGTRRRDLAGQPVPVVPVPPPCRDEGGFGLERRPAGDLVFTVPDGDELAAAPEALPVELDVQDVNRRLGVVVDSGTGAPLWGGERLDLGLTVDALLCLEGRMTA